MEPHSPTKPLLICAPRDKSAVEQVFDKWAEISLVSNVVCCDLRELANIGRGATCARYESVTNTNQIVVTKSDETIGDILNQQTAETPITLAVLRERIGHLEDLEDEKQAQLQLRQIVRGAGLLRAITVGQYQERLPLRAFTLGWDLHLLHDMNELVLPRTKQFLEPSHGAAACAMIAMCAGGGWTFSDGVPLLGSATQQVYGVWGAVRVVRPQVRIIRTGPIETEIERVTATTYQMQPPWRSPSDKTVNPLSRSIAVPEANLRQLAKQCGFYVNNEVDLGSWAPFKARVWSALKTGRLGTAVKLHGHEFTSPLTPEAINEILEVYQALDRYKGYRVSNTDDAVAAIRAAAIPGLTLGMDVSARAPHCWRFLRQFFYRLVDAGQLPSTLEELATPYAGRSDETVVWLDPTALAPRPSLEHFGLDVRLRFKLGIDHIVPLDTLSVRRADSIIMNDSDPFREVNGENDPREHVSTDELALDNLSSIAVAGTADELGFASEESMLSDVLESGSEGSALRSKWLEWLKKWQHTPLGVVSDVLGSSVDEAYGRYSDNIEFEDIEVLRTTHYSFSLVRVAVPLLLLLGCGGLLAWRVFGDDGPVPDGGSLFVFVLVMVGVLAVVCALAYRTSLNRISEEERLPMECWEQSQRAKHYACEVTRLHGLASAFRDHQEVIRSMLYKPFGNSRRQVVEKPTDEMGQLRPKSLLLAIAQLDADYSEKIANRTKDSIFKSGWLTRTHVVVEAEWAEQFEKLVGHDDFEAPDLDYSPADETVYRDRYGGNLPGTRQHLAESVVLDGSLRTAARVRAAKGDSGLTEADVQLSWLGPICVAGASAIRGMAGEFLQFQDGDPQPEAFDNRMFNNSIAALFPCSHDSVGSNGPSRIRARLDSDVSETMFVSWRMEVSAPQNPEMLTAVVQELDPVPEEVDSDNSAETDDQDNDI